jgi:hypothetical protein
MPRRFRRPLAYLLAACAALGCAGADAAAIPGDALIIGVTAGQAPVTSYWSERWHVAASQHCHGCQHR